MNSRFDDNVRLPYGIDPQTDQLIHISDSLSGLGCGLVCPGCGATLVGRKGGDRAHHFAHHGEASCSTWAETLLHLLMKQYLARCLPLKLPPRIFSHPSDENLQCVTPSEITFQTCELEQVVGSYRVDALVQTESFGAIAIEVCVCHPTEQDKADYFKTVNHPLLEIDIAKWGQQELDALPHSLVSPIKAIRWLVPVSSETKPIVRRKARNEPLFDVRSIPLDIRPRPRPSPFTFEPNILDGQVTVERQILRSGGIITLPSLHHEASHELAQGTYIWRELILHEDSANFSCRKQYGSAGRLQCWWLKANAGDLIVYFAPASLNDDDQQLLNAILSHPRRPVLEARELSQAPQRYALQWAHNPAASQRRQRYDDYVSARTSALDNAMPLLTGMAIPVVVTDSQRLSMPSALLQILKADSRAFIFAVRLLALLYRRNTSSLQFNDIFQSLCLNNEQISLSVAEEVVATLTGYQWLEPRTGIAPDFDEKVQRVCELNPSLFTFESHQAIKWSGFINEHVALLRGV